MVDVAKLKVGDKVYYQPSHYKRKNHIDIDEPEKWENGIVKEIPEGQISNVRVVYNCAGDWENYQNYTSALTSSLDLYPGWKH